MTQLELPWEKRRPTIKWVACETTVEKCDSSLNPTIIDVAYLVIYHQGFSHLTRPFREIRLGCVNDIFEHLKVDELLV